MKRLFLLLLSLCFVAGLSCCGRGDESVVVSDDPEEDAAVDLVLHVGVVVDAEVVNIRQSASLDGRILDTVRRGEMFEILESGILDAEGNSWVQIRYRGESAFVSQTYLYSFEWQENSQITIGQVLERDVYIYDAASLEAVVLYRSYKGEPLLLYEAVDADWYRVFYPHGDAFVRSEQIRIEQTTIKDMLL